ncbi:AT-hook motif nuclear-localized protein 10-like [Ananas comosus]|uniref:AT-hook motif nuclear-localized protein n=2 Tax=Ananas comosus TaxID=4615 RepID=A0A199VBH4_ANACO|nr:AT-hook motif nuclear-localized protein 10-like [Ananas comosus]OAY74363.1 AT-hook motif nuclear-localized protein 10 [Ananas comosus]
MEVRSEQGMMSGREPFNMTMQKSPIQSQPSMQSMRLAYAPDGTAIYKPITTASSPSPPLYGPAGDGTSPTLSSHGLTINMGGGGGGGGEPVKRKRGRPRKYGPDGAMALALAPAPVTSAAAAHPPGGGGMFSPSSGGAAAASQGLMKKVRGRPPGSGRKRQMAALGSAGIGFTPHVITVKAGEDVSAKIMSFSQHGPRAVCILSANGAISNVTLRQAATSGGTVTYEGRFEILSLSGSFLLSESGGQRSRTGGLSVSLAGPDGRVLGGGVAGLLTAASPVQVVVGSFIADGKKEPKQQSNPSEPASAPGKFASPYGGVGPAGGGSPPSRGTLSESSGGGPGSPLNQSTGTMNNSSQHGLSSMPWK